MAFMVDLALYLSVVFSIREVYFPCLGFMAIGLLGSLNTLVVASWRMKGQGSYMGVVNLGTQ